MKPGIYHDVPFADYLAWPVMSQSVLKQGQQSMAHLRAAELGERQKKPTDDMLLGSAMHCAFLEPELLPRRVVLWDDGARRGAKWDVFKEQHSDKIILTEGYYESLIGMVRSMRAHPFVRQWSPKIEAVEVSVVGEVHGLLMKSRCDALTNDPMVDLKKVRSADPASVMQAVLSFGYHIQAAVYRRQFGRDRFVLLCVEAEPPYDVVPFELSPALLRIGDEMASTVIHKYKEAAAANRWPGRSDEIVQLEAPEWMTSSDLSVTVGGESAFGD